MIGQPPALAYLCRDMEFTRFELDNGLRVIHHQDPHSQTVILNILYNVGARDEEADKTGFAHLFEHLMFGGSVNIPQYDKVVEEAGGSNNAYTSNDITNYHISVPLENAETAFWLESDRMLQLAFSQESLDVQRGVVVEEFKQRCHNAPFGMLWHHVRGLAYKVHPYRWPTIGLVTAHIEGARLEDVEAFYYRFYHPNNAILCVTGALSLEETKALSEKWFGSIDRKGERNANRYPEEPVQTERRSLATEDLLPQDAVLMAFRTPAYAALDWPVAGLLADICGGSETSPLHVELVKEKGLFASAEAFHMKGLSEGLWMVYGILNDGRTHEEGEAALRGILDRCSTDIPSEERLVRCRNMATTRLLFEETNPMNRAQKLCYYENIGLLEHAGKEAALLDAVNLSQLKQWAAEHLRPEKSNVIYYSPRA